MAANGNGAYELDEWKRHSGEVQPAEVDEEDGSIHAAGRSKSSVSRDEQDRIELMRLGKAPVLKVCSFFSVFCRSRKYIKTCKLIHSFLPIAQLWVHVHFGIYNHHSRHLGRCSNVGTAPIFTQKSLP